MKYAIPKLLKYLLPRHLFGRALLILWLPMIVVQAVTTFVFLDRHWYTTTREMSQSLVRSVKTVQYFTQQQKFMPQPLREEAGHLSGLEISVTKDLKELPPPDKSFPGISLLKRTLWQSGVKLHSVFASGDKLFFILPWKRQQFLVLTCSTKRLHLRTTPLFLIWMFAAPLCFFIIAALFLRNQIRPITRLSQALMEFSMGNKTKTVKPQGALEIRRAAISFNQMQQRLTRFITQRTQMLAGVSHDLKTPLTRIRLSIAMLEDKEAAQSLEEDVSHMSRIIDDYLAFSKGEHDTKPSEVSLRGFISEIIAPYKKQEKDIRYRASKDTTLLLQHQSMKRALSNLIDNGLKYGSKVEISTRISDQVIQIFVDDNGPGIPPEHYQDVLQPFQRLESSRNSSTGGIGLGLTIANDIVLAHGGSLSFTSSKTLGGLQVSLTLPKDFFHGKS